MAGFSEVPINGIRGKKSLLTTKLVMKKDWGFKDCDLFLPDLVSELGAKVQTQAAFPQIHCDKMWQANLILYTNNTAHSYCSAALSSLFKTVSPE